MFDTDAELVVCRLNHRFQFMDHLRVALGRRLLIALLIVVFSAACGLFSFSRVMFAADGGNDDAWKPPDPKEETLSTRDGLELHYTYFGGMPSKTTVPIVMLHAFKADATSLKSTALYLQELGHAVFVPDMRGHGASVHARDDNGQTIRIEAKSFTRAADFDPMVTDDLEVLKREMLRRHNNGELNIEKLTVIGVELGATIALNWAAQDWSWEQLPTIKQGQDVCTLVLISPQWNYRGIPIDAALNTPALRGEVAIQIIAGRKHREWPTAQRIFDHCKKSRPKDAKGEATLALDGIETSLADDKLLTMRGLKIATAVSNRYPSGDPRKFADKEGRLVETKIAKFIEWNSADRAAPWQPRKKSP